jgi:hypothetical protein
MKYKGTLCQKIHCENSERYWLLLKRGLVKNKLLINWQIYAQNEFESANRIIYFN